MDENESNKGKGEKRNLSIKGQIIEEDLSEYKFHQSHPKTFLIKPTYSKRSKLICSIKMIMSGLYVVLKVARVAATTAALAGGLYAVYKASASSQHEVPFGAQRDDGGPWYRPRQRATTEGWKKPEIGWVKLNVDGSREHKKPSAGCGGVLRDASGEWLCGFAKRLDPNTCQADRTELLAILFGMQLAQTINVKKLIVESDNDSVVRMVENGVTSDKPDYVVVELIRKLGVDPIWEVRFDSISNMKANRVADRLANDARELASQDAYQEYHDPPANCVQLLEEDEIGWVGF